MTDVDRPAGRLLWALLLGCALLCVVLVLVYAHLQQRQLDAVLGERADLLASVVSRSDAPSLQARLDLAGSLSAGLAAAAIVEPATNRVLAATRPEWRGTVMARLPGGGVQFSRMLTTTPPQRLLLALTPPAGGVGSPAALGTFAVSALAAALLLGAAAAGLLGRFVLRPLERLGADQQRALRRSRERLQLAVAGSNDALFDYDPAGRQLFLSDVFRRWFGGRAGTGVHVQVDLDDVMSRIHPDHAPRVYRALQVCSETGRSFDEELQVAKADGGYLWLQIRGRGVPQDDHYRISGFASDISRRKVAETLLQDSVERLGAVLDNIAEGIVTLNEAGELCAVNAAARQMFGLDRDALVGRPLATLLETAPGAGWLALADRQPREGRVVRSDGAFPAEFTVSAMHIRSDERYIVVLRDISERKMAEDKLRSAIAESEAATRAKDEFLATMSHEIRTPMNGVLGMTQLLLDMNLDAQQRETAALIRNSGESLLTIINDILDFSRAGSGRLKVDASPFDLRLAVREVVELLGRRRSAVDLYVDYPLHLPSQLIGDPGRVRQVLMNLVGNALKFTEVGHVLVSVAGTVEAAKGDGAPVAQLTISVEDTGPGISPAAQGKLFQPFTQADASTTRRFGGTGLGLAISRRLVELMGGEIGLDSEPGAGSRFFFTLQAPCAAAGEVAPPPSLAGRRVLLVDDNDCGRAVLGGYLAAAGAALVAVASAPAALERLESESFDLALIDDQMPNMDGLLLCELIRIDATWQRMQLVLMCSADIRGLDDSRAVDRCFVKPLMPDYLLHELAALLDGQRPPARHPEPAAAVQAAGFPPRAVAALPQRERGPAASEEARRQPRLLLAEDNAVNQKVAVRMLEKLGCRIDVAVDGAEAVDMWRHFDYDAIFMDCQMPELDGLEAAREVRRQEDGLGRRRTPIIAMTANAMHQDRSDCLAAGMDDYLAKPVRREDLAAMLERWVPVASLIVHSVQKTAGLDAGHGG